MIPKKDLDVLENELMGFTFPANKVQIRILNNVAGSSILVTILLETEDSFLVAAPARLMSYKDKNELQVESYTPVPYARFFKSTILSLTPPFDEFEICYISYLVDNAKGLYNGIFTDVQIDYLKTRLSDITGGKQVIKEEPTKKEELPSADSFMVLTDSKYKH